MRVVSGNVPPGDAQHTKAFFFKIGMHCVYLFPGSLVERNPRHIALLFIAGAQADNLFRGALDDQQAAIALVEQDRDAPPLEIEGYFIDFLPGADVDVLMRQDGLVERTFQAGFEEAVQVSQFQHPLARLALRVGVLFQPDLCFGQRPGLVGAENIHRSQVLDRRQSFDDDFLLGHEQCAMGQGH